ncbi:hypothetical protein HID58_094336 [Brassica napus]|uniref:Uncharacterized protein n=1 Tax=Brassica napus TaxID=3708 RepID=A0ABQ7X7J9_BRANA|nr:hypothetical protein HID58_094336 [Brassica napus]
MVETRRSYSASKSFYTSSSSPELSSHLQSLPSDLRSRSMLLLNPYASAAEPTGSSSASETVLTDVPVLEISLEADTNPKVDVVPTPTIAGEVVTDGEKSKAGKNRAKDPWAKLLSEYSQAFEFKENLKLQQFMKLACILCTCTLAIFSQLRGKVSLILSKSKKHEVGMTGITLEIIDDIHCHVLC